MTPSLPSPYCIAIVDDEPSITELARDMLSSSGADVEVFEGGLDFLKSTNLIKFHTVLLDLSLPDIDGFELMEKLAAKTSGLSIVLISGHDIEVVCVAKIYGNAIGLNVRAALTKPFTKNELFTAIGLDTNDLSR